MKVTLPQRKAVLMAAASGMWVALWGTTWGMRRFSEWLVPRDDVVGRMGDWNAMLAEAFFGWGNHLLWIEGLGGAAFLLLLWKELGGGRE